MRGRSSLSLPPTTKMLLLSALLVVPLVAPVSSVPHPTAKRQVSQLRESYDFVIAGGGTCGLTVADRLTEAFPNSQLRAQLPTPPP